MKETDIVPGSWWKSAAGHFYLCLEPARTNYHGDKLAVFLRFSRNPLSRPYDKVPMFLENFLEFFTPVGRE